MWAQSSPGVREPAREELPAAPASPASAAPSGISDSPLRSDPRTVTTAVEQAARLSKEGKPEAALASLEASLKTHPRDPQLRFLYGVIMAEQKRTDDAINVFEQLTQDFPELPEPHNNLAVVLAGRG
ncbi:MAG TPA: tetratricopeptide repeat protein, partial [Burkholderiaceae bacterium]|nr:tetratricopeptide repeat protein [Burkholderiaceae bacterium]